MARVRGAADDVNLERLRCHHPVRDSLRALATARVVAQQLDPFYAVFTTDNRPGCCVAGAVGLRSRVNDGDGLASAVNDTAD